MFPLIPSLSLALASFIASTFVILRIVIPILPPHPLSRRVSPSEFGLPDFKKLSPADKSHLWLALLDIAAVGFFLWQALTEYSGGTSGLGVVLDPVSAIRLWLATTLRQTCLLIVAALTLLHVRKGHAVGLGKIHWMLWAPTLLLVVTSTAVAGILAETGVQSYFWGLLGYSTLVAVLSSAGFACLIGTLLTIRGNLVALHGMRDSWPPAHVESEKPHQSFDTIDVDALKDGSSWITSQASSRCASISAFSFSTHHTSDSRMQSNASSGINVSMAMASNLSIPAKSQFWFNPVISKSGRSSPILPAPLPTHYRSSTPQSYNVDDGTNSFRSPCPRPRMGSQSSWLTEHSSQPTLSAWSFPLTSPSSPSSSTPNFYSAFLQTPEISPIESPDRLSPAMVDTSVIGGYGYAGEATRIDSGASGPALLGNEVDVSVYRALGWFLIIWIPMGLALPYYITVHSHTPATSPWAEYLLILSVTISSPLLAANILLRSPLPITRGLFETHAGPPSIVMRSPSPPSSTFVHEYKRSGSVTVMEGSCSGDVWLNTGNAIEDKGRVGRTLGLLVPKPKLSITPLENKDIKNVPFTTQLPIQTPISQQSTPEAQRTDGIDFDTQGEIRTRKESKASSYFSSADDHLTSQIMIAQRRYSAVAMTVILPPSPQRDISEDATPTAAIDATPSNTKKTGHLRPRSLSSISVPCSPVSAPPTSPLPPTPPSLKSFKSQAAAKRLAQRRSLSTLEGLSFGPADNTTEIDAALLPLLVPVIKVGDDVTTTENWRTSTPKSSRKNEERKSKVTSNSGETSTSDPSSSLPRKSQTNGRKKSTPTRKRHYFSLPNLSQVDDGMRSFTTWRQDLSQAIDGNTSICDDFFINDIHPSVSKEDLSVLPSSSTSNNGRFLTDFLDSSLDVPSSVTGSKFPSLATLSSALDKELQMPSASAASGVPMCDFDPSMDCLGVSTPQESKMLPRCPRDATSGLSLTSSSTSYLKFNENTSSMELSSDFGQHVKAVQPLVLKSKTRKLKSRLSKSADQENVSPVPLAAKRRLRQLSLLKKQDTNIGIDSDASSWNTQPLSMKGKGKRSGDGESVHRESTSSFKKPLNPLKLIRTETTKERAKLRETEVLPSIVIRPPSDTFSL
ncbi:hypothetical protein BDY19DRAFT_983646 [Irpex rosettiformis]|uniref:Uncharacterized protein n=1 Tax=Irpex rosettiformis TaxID=378272 RepID=A0ACB8UDB4_9APHY|nr:hypothetical protein BDY19DRAFT_983646 [Irpex rosettiformis]